MRRRRGLSGFYDTFRTAVKRRSTMIRGSGGRKGISLEEEWMRCLSRGL